MRFALITVIALLALGAYKLPDWVMDSRPLVEAASPTDSDYQTRARNLFHGTVLTHSGTQATPIKRVVLTADDIAAALNFALLRKKLEGSASCEIRGDRLLIHTSARLLGHSDRPWLNIRISATDAPASARIRNLRIGQINLPYPIGGWLVRSLLHVPPLSRFEGIGDEVIRDIHIGNERLVLTMNWDKHVLSQGGASITELADEKLLRIYYDYLAGLLNDGSHSRFVRLGKLMQPLFELAKTRSGEGGDPVAENRAVIVLLSAYTNGNDLSESLSSETRLPKRGVLLNKRIDTAKHFLGAAVLAMSGQGTLVEIAGLAKELHDTHDGSGFSFIDLAADEAGAVFGKAATRAPEKARRIQDALSASADESQFIPGLKDLPESMDPETFAARFKNIQSSEFAALKRQIGERIRALPVYQGL